MNSLNRAINRRGEPLGPERASNRISAYVYGNILVLAAVAGASSPSIESGTAVFVVLGTTLSTFLAHVFADSIAHSVTHDGERSPLRQELRDSVPILTSGTLPVIALALAWWGLLPNTLAQVIAGGIIAVRLASLEVILERLQGRSFSWRMLVAGLVFAGLCATIIALKLSLHY